MSEQWNPEVSITVEFIISQLLEMNLKAGTNLPVPSDKASG